MPLSPLCLLVALLLAVPVVSTQVLPLAEASRAALAPVVRADSLPSGLLYQHARCWLWQRGYQLAQADSVAGRRVAAHAFGGYDHGYVTRHLHGKVRYRLLVEGAGRPLPCAIHRFHLCLLPG